MRTGMTRCLVMALPAPGIGVGGVEVQFDRDAAGKVSGLGLWAPGARDTRMERVK